MFEGIKALILYLAATQYPANTIFQGYGNNVNYPDDDNFVVMIQMEDDTLGLPQYEWDEESEEETYTTLDYTPFQIDFYGSNAYSVAKKMKVALESTFGVEFLSAYGCEPYQVSGVLNLTEARDREKYIPRQALRFSLFNNGQLVVNTPSFDTLDVDIRLAEVQTPTP